MALTLIPSSSPVEASTSATTPAFKIPLLTEMSRAEQRAFLTDAHDAILAVQLPKLGVTVKEALLRLAIIKAISPEYTVEAYQIESTLRLFNVQLGKPWRKRRDEYIAAAETLVSHGYSEEMAAELLKSKHDAMWSAGGNDRQGLHTVGGEGPTPIGYVEDILRPRTRAEKALLKPLLPYLDCFPRIGFPLYHTSYKHLIDVFEVLDYYLPYHADEERESYELSLAKKRVATVASDSQEAVARRAHAAILATPLNPDGTVTIREVLQNFKAARTSREVLLWGRILERAGVEAQPDDADCAGLVVKPRQLIGKNRLELTPFLKILGSTRAGARDVRFKLYI